MGSPTWTGSPPTTRSSGSSERFDEVFDPSNKGLIGGYFDASAPVNAEIDDVPDLGAVDPPEPKWPDLVDTIAHRNAVRIGSQLLDVPVDGLETWTHMIDKPPHRGHETPWHQDEAFWEEHLGYHACGVWLALDDVDRDNGCMEFLPHSHLGGIVTHRHLYDDPMVSALVIDDVDEAAGRARAARAPAGPPSTPSGPCTTPAPTTAAAGVGPSPSRSRSRPTSSTSPIPKPWKTF